MDEYMDRYHRFLEGEDDQLEFLVEKYRYGLSLFVNGIVKNICIAEDVMQDTFVMLAIKRPKFKGESSFRTWLYTIARNKALDYLKIIARKRTIPIDECFEMSDEQDVEKQYIKEEERRELHRAMIKLKTEYAQVIYLTFFEEFSGKETAAIMHKTPKQVENLLFNAKKALKEELERSGFVYEDI